MAKHASLDGFVDTLVEMIAERLKARVAEIADAAVGGRKAKGNHGAGQKRDMRCRYPACWIERCRRMGTGCRRCYRASRRRTGILCCLSFFHLWFKVIVEECIFRLFSGWW